MSKFTEKNACRVCGESTLSPVLDMGAMPPSNGFRENSSTTERSFPLEVVFCESCTHLQLQHTVDRQFLFSDYPYFASDSGSSEHFREYAELLERLYLHSNDLAVDVGSNDGGLLSYLSEGIDRLGVEPAENTAAVAEERGVPTVTEFFSAATAEEIRRDHGPADVICANNVLAHIDDLDEFMRGVDALLARSGALVVEVPYLLDLITEVQLSTIYHEHLSYFSIRSLTHLMDRYDFVLTDAERLDRHGGSIRVHVHRKAADVSPSANLADLQRLERSRRLGQHPTLEAFARRAEDKADAINDLVTELSEAGHEVVGYGASAKGNVLLNYCDLGPEQVTYLVDQMPAKQGTYAPGTEIPVRSPETFREDHPDYAFVLAWNYTEQIVEKEAEFAANGNSFIVPTPMPDIVY